MTGSLVEKRDLVFQIFMDFMDFKMEGIVADTSLSSHLNSSIWFFCNMPQKTTVRIKEKSYKVPVFNTSSKHLFGIFFNGFSQLYLRHS